MMMPSKSHLSLHSKDVLASLLFLVPFFIFFILFKIYPMINGFLISLTKSNILGIGTKFIGLKNYVKLFGDEVFWESLKNTLLFGLFTTPLMIPLALALAVGLYNVTKTANVLRGIFFMPRILSVSVISLIWLWIYQPQWGLLNNLLGFLGLPLQDWLNHPFMALMAIVFVDAWWNIGYQMIILLAGLQQIPVDLYEAASIEGANQWQKFIYITIPNLKSSLLFVVVTHIIGSFQVFGMIYIMTEGGPYGSTRVMVQYMYENAFEYNKMGYGSAIAYILMMVILMVTLVQFKIFKRDKV